MNIIDSRQLRFKVAALFLTVTLALVTSTTLAQIDSGSGFEIETAQPAATALEPVRDCGADDQCQPKAHRYPA